MPTFVPSMMCFLLRPLALGSPPEPQNICTAMHRRQRGDHSCTSSSSRNLEVLRLACLASTVQGSGLLLQTATGEQTEAWCQAAHCLKTTL